MAEALLRAKGGAEYEVVSAGTDPGEVRPLTLRVLAEAGLPTVGLRSKSVAEVIERPFDIVITVCDSARQQCPVFPGEGERQHWSYDDPSAVEGDEATRLRAYRQVFTAISQRIEAFLTLQARARARRA
jgi:arsenate reductase